MGSSVVEMVKSSGLKEKFTSWPTAKVPNLFHSRPFRGQQWLSFSTTKGCMNAESGHYERFQSYLSFVNLQAFDGYPFNNQPPLVRQVRPISENSHL